MHLIQIAVLIMLLGRSFAIRGVPCQLMASSFSKRLKSRSKPLVVPSYDMAVSVVSSTHEMKGRRPYMEDRLITGFGDRLAVVCDGHGGAGVADALHKNYLNILKEKYLDDESLPSMEKQEVIDALLQAMNDVDNIVLPDHKLHMVGSTFCLSFVHSNPQHYIITVNVGDSRVILSQGGKAIDLSVDHKPSSKSEKNRIEKLGGIVKYSGGCQRVGGVLALSRSIGDRYLKPYVSSDADVRVHNVTPKDEFVIVATDGIWDDFTSQEAVDFVHDIVKRIEVSMKDPDTLKSIMVNFPDVTDTEWIKRKLATELFCHCAIKKGSTDNVSAVIQWLDVKEKEQ